MLRGDTGTDQPAFVFANELRISYSSDKIKEKMGGVSSCYMEIGVKQEVFDLHNGLIENMIRILYKL